MGRKANLRKERKAEKRGLAISNGKIKTIEYDDFTLACLIEVTVNSSPHFVDAFLESNKVVELGLFYHYIKSIAPQKDGEFERFYNSVTGSRYWFDFAMTCTRQKDNELILIQQSEKNTIGFGSCKLDEFLSRLPENDFGYQNLVGWLPRLNQRRQEKSYFSGCFSILDKFHNMSSLWYGLEDVS